MNINPAPSPWHRADSTQVIASDGSHVADCAHSSDSRTVGLIACANARLIECAPEMLECLQELLADKYLSDQINNDRMAKAREIVKKAIG